MRVIDNNIKIVKDLNNEELVMLIKCLADMELDETLERYLMANGLKIAERAPGERYVILNHKFEAMMSKMVLTVNNDSLVMYPALLPEFIISDPIYMSYCFNDEIKTLINDGRVER